MKTVTIASKLTEKMSETVDELVKEGIYANRSDAVRDAVRLLIGMQGDMYHGRSRPIDRKAALKELLKEKGLKL